MGEKTEAKRELILEKARAVFAAKGYQNVTMKDIVDACEISRGGLYLYFGSTAEIFEAVLAEEYKGIPDPFAGLSEDSDAAEYLMAFLRREKMEILKKKDSINRAHYEYLFTVHPEKKDNMMRSRMNTKIRWLTSILEAGDATGIFYAPDPEGAARNILFMLEGLRICALTIGITESVLDRELKYMLEGLLTQD